MFTVVVAAIFMSNLDLFIVNVALPSIGRDFGGASLAGLSWVLNAYAIVFAALLGGAAVAIAWFLWRCSHHERPLVELHLLRIPAFRSASAAVFVFSIGFAAMLLSNVLWCQTVWHYSALRTGLAIAPGPAMVPALAVGAGPLARRIGSAPVAAAGNLLFAAGLLWRVFAVSVVPHYAVDMLPSMLLTGMGVGLTLPTLMSASTTALPAARFGTGSALVNMARQVAAALGVAVLVTIIGIPATAADAVTAFRHLWLIMAGAAVLAATAAAFVRRPPPVPAPSAPAASSALSATSPPAT